MYGSYTTHDIDSDMRIIVDFKSEYNKTKISEMGISNIYLKNESFEIFA